MNKRIKNEIIIEIDNFLSMIENYFDIYNLEDNKQVINNIENITKDKINKFFKKF